MQALVVEGDAEIRALIAAELRRRDIDAHGVATVVQAIESLRAQRYEVVVLDLGLPDGNGMDVLGRIRATLSPSHVIVLSGTGTEPDRVRALDLGADDYVAKPFSVRELGARIAAVGRRRTAARGSLQFPGLTVDLEARDVNARGDRLELTAKEFDLLAFLAARPGHVFSRAELLAAVWESAPDWQRASTVTEHIRRLRLKLERDPAHPQLLRTVRGAGYRFDAPPGEVANDAARAARARLQPPSEYLRYLIDGVGDVSDAVIVADADLVLRGWNVAAERLYGWRSDDVIGRPVTEVLFWTSDAESRGEAVESLRATGRWYGRIVHVARDGTPVEIDATTTMLEDDDGTVAGVVSVHRPVRPSEDRARSRRLPGTDELRRAIERRELAVHFQPVVELATGRVIAGEAVARWRSANRPPDDPENDGELMELAESSGLVVELGRALITLACESSATWRRGGLDIGLTVNLAAGQLADVGLVDFIARTLHDTGLPPRSLCLEVTETALVQDVDHARRQLHGLAALGTRIVIDDFGTGWASLTYLRQFPVDALKIDRSFVAGIPTDSRDTAIARSIVGLAADLGIVVVGQGIDTEAQRAALTAMGCHLGEGHLFGPPACAAEFIAASGRTHG